MPLTAHSPGGRRIEIQGQSFAAVVERRVRRLDVIELYAVLTALEIDPDMFVRELYRSLPHSIAI